MSFVLLVLVLVSARLCLVILVLVMLVSGLIIVRPVGKSSVWVSGRVSEKGPSWPVEMVVISSAPDIDEQMDVSMIDMIDGSRVCLDNVGLG